jgi:alpha-L-arabinofuranosidase
MYRMLAIAALMAAMSMTGCSMMNSQASMAPQDATITVNADRPGPRVNPAMWGAFFEDINFGADGGLYAEMVKNRSFEFPEPLMGWSKVSPSLAKGNVQILTEAPYRETNPNYARITSMAAAPIGIVNEGFRGMGVRAGELYDFSAQIRGIEGSPRVTVEIIASDGTTLAEARLSGISSGWGKITATLKPKDTDPKAKLGVFVYGQGIVDFENLSLFPQKTWKNRPGGLRADMVQALADLHPGFLRFPGGCIVEGKDLSTRYQWKNTIGPVEDRKLLVNRWNYEFKHRPTPDYYQSFGLGFFEFFQLCEDIGAEPLPIINCGMACQFNSGELCPIDELGPYIQDALDLIEFANGSVTSTWGAKRAEMGHPAPFNMKMMGVGNEQWAQQYLDRLAVFTKAIKEKHPEITLVSDAGPSPEDDRFDFLWPRLTQMKAELVDQHCYANPIWFLANSDRYDKYDRNGPKVFFGEYGAQSVAIVSPKNRNNLECALAEAAYMTGLERNADVVRMASYAPLFANEEAWQWTPDLIWTNSLQVLPTPNYYVQQLFTTNRGDVVLPATNNAPVKELLPNGGIGIGTSRASAEFKDIRVTSGDKTLLAPDATSMSPWTPAEGWQTSNGAYVQTNANAISTVYAGDRSWTDYTLTLKARKTGGADGLAITVLDNGNAQYARWFLGGWGNAQHGIVTHYAEQDQLIERVPGSLETGRWYDIKIVVKQSKIECYLDGKLIQTAEVLRHRVPTLFTSATRDEKTGETILKVVNPGDQPTRATIKINGVSSLAPTGRATILTGKNADENTFQNPRTITPITTTVNGVKPQFGYIFQPRSITVLRLAK